MKSKAFTLVELLVVIAIIALLMGILLPSLNAARQQAQMVACQSHLKHWGSIFTMFTNDNDGYFHPGWENPLIKEHLWLHIYRPYYGEKDDFRTCPSAKKVDLEYKNGGSKYAWGLREGWVGDLDNYGSYGLNGWVCHQQADAPWNAGDRDKYWRKITVKGQLSKMPILFDSAYWKIFPKNVSPPNEQYDWGHYLDENNYMVIGDHNKGYIDGVCIDRHNCTVNMLFFDTSVSRTSLRKLWDLKWHKQWERPEWLDDHEWPRWLKK